MLLAGAATQDERIKEIIQGPGDVEWKYEMRRQCQEILPNLWLGPFLASKNLELLQSLSITHILCIRDVKEAFSVKPRFLDHFQYMTLDVQDNEDQNLIRLFSGAKRFIDDAIKAGGRVLVHCNGGISLSPAFVIMYTMQYYNINADEGLHLVQQRRYCISPNSGFLQQIKEFEAIYRASAAVTTAPTMMERATSRRKREEDDDEDMREDDRKRAYMDDHASTDNGAMEL